MSNLRLLKLNFFLYQIFFLYLTKQENIYFYLLYIQGWATIFSLLEIKLHFSSLLVRNAKLVSFFFVRNYYLSTKIKIQCEDETLYFSYTYIGFSAVFALVFLIFLVRFNDFYNKKSPDNMPKLLYLSHILDFSKIF